MLFKHIAVTAKPSSLLPAYFLPTPLQAALAQGTLPYLTNLFYRLPQQSLGTSLREFNGFLNVVLNSRSEEVGYRLLADCTAIYSELSFLIAKKLFDPACPSMLKRKLFNAFSDSSKPGSTHALLSQVLFQFMPSLVAKDMQDENGGELRKFQTVIVDQRFVELETRTKDSLGSGTYAKAVSVTFPGFSAPYVQKKDKYTRGSFERGARGIDEKIMALMMEVMTSTRGGLTSFPAVKEGSRTSVAYPLSVRNDSTVSMQIFECQVYTGEVFTLTVPPNLKLMLSYTRTNGAVTYIPYSRHDNGNPDAVCFFGKLPHLSLRVDRDVTHVLEYINSRKKFVLHYKAIDITRFSIFQPFGDALPELTNPFECKTRVFDLIRNLLHAVDTDTVSIDTKPENMRNFNGVRQIDYGGCVSGDYDDFYWMLVLQGSTKATFPSPELADLCNRINSHPSREMDWQEKREKEVNTTIGKDFEGFILRTVVYQTALSLLIMFMSMPLSDKLIGENVYTTRDILKTIYGLSHGCIQDGQSGVRLEQVTEFFRLSAVELFGANADVFYTLISRAVSPDPSVRPKVAELREFMDYSKGLLCVEVEE